MLSIIVILVSCDILSEVHGYHASPECDNCPVQWPAPEISSQIWRYFEIGVNFNEVYDTTQKSYSLYRDDESLSGSTKVILTRKGLQIPTLNILTAKMLEDLRNEQAANVVRSTGPLWVRHFSSETQFQSENLPGNFKKNPAKSNTQYFRFFCTGDLPNKSLHVRVVPECVYNMAVCYSATERTQANNWQTINLASSKPSVSALPITITSAKLRRRLLRIEYTGGETMDSSQTQAQNEDCKTNAEIRFVIYYDGHTVMEDYHKPANLNLNPIVATHTMPFDNKYKGHFEVNIDDINENQIQALKNKILDKEADVLSYTSYARNGLFRQFYQDGTKKFQLAVTTCACSMCREWLLTDLSME